MQINNVKKIFVFLTFVCVLSTLSCTSKKEFAREDVFGVWEATEESLKEQQNIVSFQLNEDSTAIICRNGFTQEKTNGTWLWDIEKKLGMGISFRYDVKLVDYALTDHLILGLLLEERDGNLYLTARDYEFMKID